MHNNGKNLRALQRRFLIGGALIAPISPLLYLQGQITRWKVGVLPNAAGPLSGVADNAGSGGNGGDGGDAADPAKLFVIGESTVAGLGARTHETALAGQFAKQLSRHIERSVAWDVIGKNGVTARRTIDELVPQMPDKSYDHILLGIGGNDVMRLSSPVKWHRDMIELIGQLRERQPRAVIFISNCPMIIFTWSIPPPAKQLLWKLSQMHDANIREFTRDMDRVFYYPQPVEVRVEGFFADGIHPSEQGYADWAAAMMGHFTKNYEW